MNPATITSTKIIAIPSHICNPYQCNIILSSDYPIAPPPPTSSSPRPTKLPSFAELMRRTRSPSPRPRNILRGAITKTRGGYSCENNSGGGSPRCVRSTSMVERRIRTSGNGLGRSKRPWTKMEDEKLCVLVREIGVGLWAAIASRIVGRTGKQVRERWLNHLSPNVVKRPWSVEEDELIVDMHLKVGNCWSRIAKMMKGRSDNSVKNRFYTTLKRRLAKNGGRL